jgi:hypothetical protein
MTSALLFDHPPCRTHQVELSALAPVALGATDRSEYRQATGITSRLSQTAALIGVYVS